MKKEPTPRKDSRRKLNLNANLMARASALAASRGQSFNALVEELIYRELISPSVVSPYTPLERAEELHAAERAAGYDKPATGRRSSAASK